MPLRDTGTDVAHDLLDIDMLAMLARALLRRLCGPGPSPLVPASIGAATSTMEVLPAVLWILISHRCGQYF
jgi:hypothetical protein